MTRVCEHWNCSREALWRLMPDKGLRFFYCARHVDWGMEFLRHLHPSTLVRKETC